METCSLIKFMKIEPIKTQNTQTMEKAFEIVVSKVNELVNAHNLDSGECDICKSFCRRFKGETCHCPCHTPPKTEGKHLYGETSGSEVIFGKQGKDTQDSGWEEKAREVISPICCDGTHIPKAIDFIRTEKAKSYEEGRKGCLAEKWVIADRTWNQAIDKVVEEIEKIIISIKSNGSTAFLFKALLFKELLGDFKQKLIGMKK